jgi:hypothetical protein
MLGALGFGAGLRRLLALRQGRDRARCTCRRSSSKSCRRNSVSARSACSGLPCASEATAAQVLERPIGNRDGERQSTGSKPADSQKPVC